MKRAWKGYLLIAPMLAGFLLFYVVPFGQVVWDSLSQGTGKSQLFVGLENYTRMFQNDMFLQAFGNTLRFLGIGLPVILELRVVGGDANPPDCWGHFRCGRGDSFHCWASGKRLLCDVRLPSLEGRGSSRESGVRGTGF